MREGRYDRGQHRRTRFLSRTIAIAPTSEQQRIVAAIEQQFSRLDAGVASLESARQKLRRVRAAILKDAIEGRLVPHDPNEPAVSTILPVKAIADAALPEQPENWATTTVADIARVTSGATPSRQRSDYWTGGSIPWVTSTLLNATTVQQANQFVTPRALAETSIKLMPPGTLLVAMYGEGQTRGRCSELLIEATTNQACAAILLRSELAKLQPYLKLFLIASYEANRRLSVGGVQPNLSVGTIKDIRIALPPIHEQARILSEADRQLASLDRLEDALVRQEHRSRRLRSSVLTAALSGQLVSQNPSDEPASALLDRIATERAASGGVQERRLADSADRDGGSTHERQRHHRPEALELLQRPARRRPLVRRLHRAAHLPAVPQDGGRADAAAVQPAVASSPRAATGPSLHRLDGDELEAHYRHTLAELGKQPGTLGRDLPQGAEQDPGPGQAQAA